MNAVPLTKPNGKVYAWACGVCGCVGRAGSVRLTRNGRRWGATAEESRYSAVRCCLCSTCGKLPRSTSFGGRCVACDVAATARAAEERTAAVALTETSVPAPDEERYEIVGGSGRVEISLALDPYGISNTATARFRPEGRPEINHDYAEHSRSEAFAVYGAAVKALHHLDWDGEVPTLRRVPEPFDFGDDFAGALAFVMAVETPRDAAALITADTLATYLRARAWEPADAEPWPWGAAWYPPASGGVVAYVAHDESESAPDVVRLDCGAVGVVEGRAAEMVLAELLVAQWRTGGFRAGGTT